MALQRRMFCRECKKEWLVPTQMANSSPVSITGNPPGQNCDVCGSPEIEYVQYDNAPGFDIPRDSSSLVRFPRTILDKIDRKVFFSEDPPAPLMASLKTIQENNNLSKDEVELAVKILDRAIREDIDSGAIYDLSDMD